MSAPKHIGEPMTIAQFARAINVPVAAVKRWIVQGYSPDDLLLEIHIVNQDHIRPVLTFKKYREILDALAFYADDGTYMVDSTKERGEEHVWRREIFNDRGRRARVCLGEEERDE